MVHCEGAERLQRRAYLIRYADDYLGFFQYKDDAEKFYGNMKERRKKFNMEIAEEKTGKFTKIEERFIFDCYQIK